MQSIGGASSSNYGAASPLPNMMNLNHQYHHHHLNSSGSVPLMEGKKKQHLHQP